MTYEQFWLEDCTIVRAYRKADEMRQERKNTEAWLSGMYVYDALIKVAPYFRSLKPQEPGMYPEHPYDFGYRKPEEQAATEEERIIKGRDVFFATMIEFNKNFKKRGESVAGGNGRRTEPTDNSECDQRIESNRHTDSSSEGI